MNNERIEENEGSIKLSKGMSQGQFNNYTSKVLTEDSVSHDDLEMLIILLVKRDRKMSGDQIQDLVDKAKELEKIKKKHERQFQKKNAALKKTDRDKLAKR